MGTNLFTIVVVLQSNSKDKPPRMNMVLCFRSKSFKKYKHKIHDTQGYGSATWDAWISSFKINFQVLHLDSEMVCNTDDDCKLLYCL